jgi:hypothetical protein
LKVAHPHPEKWHKEFEVEGEKSEVNVSNSGLEGCKVGHDQVVNCGVKYDGTLSESQIIFRSKIPNDEAR